MNCKYFRGLNTALALMLLFGAGCGRTETAVWYKGNLHTHSFWSDGDDFPESIIAWYQDNGYDFVAVSDHNTIAAEGEEKWVSLEEGSEKSRAFSPYIVRFGEDWVEYEQVEDTLRVRLKSFEEYASRFHEEGQFLVIRSEEISDRYEQKPIHINATNIADFIPPQGGSSVVDVMQRNIDAVLEQRRETGQPMFPHINHPNFGWALTAEELAEVVGEQFVEIYNGHPAVHNEGDSLRPSVEMIWDYVNTQRISDGRPLMYGIGVDDAHRYFDFGSSFPNTGRAWVMVRASSLTIAAIVEAMEEGRFYASTGVQLEKISVDRDKYAVSVLEEEGVAYTIEFVGNRLDSARQFGEVLLEVESGSGSYEFQGDELFVRARITSSRPMTNPYRSGETEKAWTQPVTPE